MESFTERIKTSIKNKSRYFRHMRDCCKIVVSILSNGVIIIHARRSYFILAESMGAVEYMYRGSPYMGEIMITPVEKSQCEIICAISEGKLKQGICYRFNRTIHNGEFVYICRKRYELTSRAKYIAIVGEKAAPIGPHSAELSIISCEPTNININAISECILFTGRDKLNRLYMLTKRGYRYFINPSYTKYINFREYVYAAYDNKPDLEISQKYSILYDLDSNTLPFLYNLGTKLIEFDNFEYCNLYGAFEILYDKETDKLKHSRWNNMEKIVKVPTKHGIPEYYAKCGRGAREVYYKYTDYAYSFSKIQSPDFSDLQLDISQLGGFLSNAIM